MNIDLTQLLPQHAAMIAMVVGALVLLAGAPRLELKTPGLRGLFEDLRPVWSAVGFPRRR